MDKEPSLKEEFAASVEPKFRSMSSANRTTFTGTVAKIVTDFLLAFQLAVMAFLYAFFAWYFPVFYYVSLVMTFCACIYILVSEKDGLSKSSWLFLMIISFGCGYIILLLSDTRVCCGYDRRRFAEIYSRCRRYTPAFVAPASGESVANDCRYFYKAGGFVPYKNTRMRYFNMGAPLFNDMLTRMEEATEFIFVEFFTFADGALLERLLSVLKRKAAQGVKVRAIYDDAGCQGVLSRATKKRMREAGIELKVFQRMLSLFSFGLNIRDHRKIVVIDGKTAYVGGCNVADKYSNLIRMQAVWKDAGVRLEGEGVDGLTLMFLRQWEFVTKDKVDFGEYIGRYEKFENDGIVVPYSGGADLAEGVCRGAYINLVSGAEERLYIMTPYFIPGAELYQLIKNKALSGVDVRLVLPAVPDWKFIYRVTRYNAESLVKYGVKVYYVKGTFVHSKVAITENAAIVGSVNMDMRSFNMQYDNAVYTDDAEVMSGILSDFAETMLGNQPSDGNLQTRFQKFLASVLKIVSPLM